MKFCLYSLSLPIPCSSVWGKGTAPSCVQSATNNHSLNCGSPGWEEWAGAVDSLHTMSWHGQGILPLNLVGGTAIPGNSGVAKRRGSNQGTIPGNRVGCLRGEGQARGLGLFRVSSRGNGHLKCQASGLYFLDQERNVRLKK